MPTVLIPLLIAFDQILKLWALENLSPIPRPLLGDLLYLTLVKNTGAGFGLLQDQAQILGWLSLLVGGFLLYLLGFRRYPLGLTLGLSLVAAGPWAMALTAWAGGGWWTTWTWARRSPSSPTSRSSTWRTCA